MKYNLVVVGGGLTGVAAAFKSEKNAHTVDVKSLQNKLLENGAVL